MVEQVAILQLQNTCETCFVSQCALLLAQVCVYQIARSLLAYLGFELVFPLGQKIPSLFLSYLPWASSFLHMLKSKRGVQLVHSCICAYCAWLSSTFCLFIQIIIELDGVHKTGTKMSLQADLVRWSAVSVVCEKMSSAPGSWVLQLCNHCYGIGTCPFCLHLLLQRTKMFLPRFQMKSHMSQRWERFAVLLPNLSLKSDACKIGACFWNAYK
jgi:hypothetical protein